MDTATKSPKHVSPALKCPSVKRLCPSKTPPNSPVNPLPQLILEPEIYNLNQNKQLPNTN